MTKVAHNKSRVHRARLIVLVLMSLLVTVGCTQRTGVGWADVRVMDDSQNILVTFQDNLALLSRANGFRVASDFEDVVAASNVDGAWSLEGGDIGAAFYTEPLRVRYGTTDMLLLADYNNRLFYVNYSEECFSNRFGSCIREGTPLSVALDGHVVADMAQDDERIYVPFAEHDVVALNKGLYEAGWDTENADERNEREPETLTTVWTFETERGVWAQPLVLDGQVYITAMDHHLYRVEAETGEELGRIDLGGAMASKPLVYDGTEATDYSDEAGAPEDATIDLDSARLYVGTFGRRIYEVPLSFTEGDAEDLDSYTTADWVWGAPKIVDGVLYAADLGGWVYAIDISNGGFEELWRVNPGVGGFRASPLVTEDYVILGSRDGKVQWLRRNDGSSFTMQDARAEILSDLVLIPGVDGEESLVVVSTVNPDRLLSVYTLDGAARWSFPSS